ncbi:MAG: ribokinase [Bacteroides sp.]|nr:ribokinase [Bacteroides sp.]
MDTKKRIIVIGSSNTDMVIKADCLPKPGETILGGSFIMNHGGKGANQAVAAARLGGDVTFICKVGNDVFGSDAVESLHKEAIETAYISVADQQPSGVALIHVDSNGENTIVVASGANNSLSVEDINKAEAAMKEAYILMMQLEIPVETVSFAAKAARKNGTIVVLNPAPAPGAKLPEELWKSVDILIPNVTEAEILSGITIDSDESARKAIHTIRTRGIPTVILTMGAKGVLAFHEGAYIRVPAFKVEATDTTAAGDTFCGALCVALSEGQSLEDGIRFACKASSVSVTRMGAQQSMPVRDEICL